MIKIQGKQSELIAEGRYIDAVGWKIHPTCWSISWKHFTSIRHFPSGGSKRREDEEVRAWMAYCWFLNICFLCQEELHLWLISAHFLQCTSWGFSISCWALCTQDGRTRTTAVIVHIQNLIQHMIEASFVPHRRGNCRLTWENRDFAEEV